MQIKPRVVFSGIGQYFRELVHEAANSDKIESLGLILDPEAVVEVIQQRQPNVIVLYEHLAKYRLPDFISRIKAIHFAGEVILLAFSDSDDVFAAISAGVTSLISGYTLTPNEFVSQIEQAANGQVVMNDFQISIWAPFVREVPKPDRLSPKQRLLLRQLAQGVGYFEMEGYFGETAGKLKEEIEETMKLLTIESKWLAVAYSLHHKL